MCSSDLPDQAQKVMSQVTIYFGVAPAVAPIIGGWLYVHLGWHSIFWFLVGVGVLLFTTMARMLPESLHPSQRQPFHPRSLLKGYAGMAGSPVFLALAFASGVPFNGMFLYVLSAPVFLGEVLHLGPTEFFWFFLLTIGGIMAGAWWSGRLAGAITRARQIRRGFRIMVGVSLLNVALNAFFTPQAWWALPLIALFAFGWALMVPVVTLMVLDQAPDRRGMASSLQACLGSVANALVAGLVAPLVMHSPLALAITSLGLLCIGLLSWAWVRTRVPT